MSIPSHPRADELRNTFQTRPFENGSSLEGLKNFPTESELRDVLKGLATDIRVEFLCYSCLNLYDIAHRRLT